jgi:hypothetical protein
VEDYFNQNQKSTEIWDISLENGVFDKLIANIGVLTGEKPRYKVEKSSKEVSIKEEDNLQDQIQTNVTSTENTKKDNKSKGVGYTTDAGTAWDVSEYLKNKE